MPTFQRGTFGRSGYVSDPFDQAELQNANNQNRWAENFFQAGQNARHAGNNNDQLQFLTWQEQNRNSREDARSKAEMDFARERLGMLGSERKQDREWQLQDRDYRSPESIEAGKLTGAKMEMMLMELKDMKERQARSLGAGANPGLAGPAPIDEEGLVAEDIAIKSGLSPLEARKAGRDTSVDELLKSLGTKVPAMTTSYQSAQEEAADAAPVPTWVGRRLQDVASGGGLWGNSAAASENKSLELSAEAGQHAQNLTTAVVGAINDLQSRGLKRDKAVQLILEQYGPALQTLRKSARGGDLQLRTLFATLGI